MPRSDLVKSICCFVVLAALTALVPMVIYLTIGQITTTRRIFWEIYFDLQTFLTYFLIGLFGYLILKRIYTQVSTASMILGAILGTFIYPIDTLPFLMTGEPVYILGWLINKILAVSLGVNFERAVKLIGKR